MTQRALIVAVNPMPRLYVEGLVRDLALTHHVTVLTFYREPLFSPELTRQVTAAGAEVVQRQFTTRADYLRQLRSTGRWLRRWLAQGGEMDVFLCQPNHLLTNYLTFAGRRRYGHRVHLIPDGMANFYMVGLRPYLEDMRRKRVVGHLVGLPYENYGGDYLALKSGAYTSYRYLGSPGIVGDYMHCEPFQVTGKPEVTKPDRWLFLGQPAPNEKAVAEAEGLLRKARARFGPQGDYKPHPAEHLDERRSALLAELGMEVVTSEVSGEAFAAAYGDVMGIGSSVLINLRMLGWGGRVHSVMGRRRLALLTGRTAPEMDQVVSALRDLGVHRLDKARSGA